MSRELVEVLVQVVTSWQVLAVTGALILYLFLVFSAARGHKRPHSVARIITAVKAKKRVRPVGEPDAETPEGNDLGLEE